MGFVWTACSLPINWNICKLSVVKTAWWLRCVCGRETHLNGDTSAQNTDNTAFISFHFPFFMQIVRFFDATKTKFSKTLWFFFVVTHLPAVEMYFPMHFSAFWHLFIMHKTDKWGPNRSSENIAKDKLRQCSMPSNIFR